MSKIEIPEYKSECSIPASQMRSLSDINLLLLKVYKPYRYGWDDAIKKYRSFYYFPSRLTQDVVYSWDESAKIQEGDTFVLREKYWDNDAKKFAFKKIMLDKAFYKTFKKVFDTDVSPETSAKFKVWDWAMQKEVEVSLWLGNTFTLRAVPAARIIGMIEALELDSDVVLVKGKTRTWDEAMVRPFDFEDGKIDQLPWNFIKFKVRGEWMDTRYQFKEGKVFDITPPSNPTVSEMSEEDIPFR